MVQRANQWCLAFYMGSDVRLGDVTAALEGSPFSVPLDKLRFFGHVILEIDARSASRQALLSDLEALHCVSVAESKADANLLLVTVDMPYPIDNGKSDLDTVGWVKFQRNDFASDQSTRSEPPVTTQKLPSYNEIRAAAAKHSASLKGIRWSTTHACRPLGGLTEPAAKTASRPAGSPGR